MVRIAALLFVLISCRCMAEDTLSATVDSTRYEFSAHSEFFLNSNSLNTKVISRFYFGRTLPKELRQKISDRSPYRNRAAFRLSNGVSFGWKTSQITWNVGFEDNMFSDAKYTRDIYDLVFLGNQKFQGETADLSRSGFRYWRYEQLKVKAAFQRGNGVWETGVSLISAHNFFQVETGNSSSLFTDTFGIALDLKADARMRRAATNALSKGQGAAIDLAYSFHDERINSKVRISIKDFGIVQFKKNTLTETIDTVIHYEGFELERLFPFGDSINPSISGDSIKNRYVERDSSTFTAMIPAMGMFELTQQQGAWTYTESLVLRPFTYALPELRFEASKSIRKFHYSLVGQLGGYSYAGAGFKVGYRSRSTALELDASHVEGLIFPGLTTGILIGLRFNTWF